MTLATIFIPQRLPSPGSTITVDNKKELHHLHVRRVKIGERVRLIDGSGHACLAEVEHTTSRNAIVRVLSVLPHSCESPLATTLVLALVRIERLEYALEKATELGVHQVVLFPAKYSRKYRAEARLPRWRRIVQEASKQCQRSQVPSLTLLPSLDSLTIEGGSGLRFVCDPTPTAAPAHWRSFASSQPASVTIVIGPEAGLSPEELAFLHTKGFAPVSLGPRILRTETAVTVALSLVQFLWGDLNPAAAGSR